MNQLALSGKSIASRVRSVFLATLTIGLSGQMAMAHSAPAAAPAPAAPKAIGGEFIPANSAEASADLRTDQQFRTLFQTWKKMDARPNGVIAIPSVHPVEKLQFTSNFGIRSDPFRGTAAMHAGVDIPGPVGTPIYATADGIVDHAGWQGGYGNLVEVNHGKGIATRYGHLSKILVADGARDARQIRVDGGMAANDWFCQFLADMLDTDVVRPANIETTAAGAAFLAGMAVGIWNGPDDIAATWKEDRIFTPAMTRDARASLMDGWQDAVDRTSSRKKP